MHIGRALPHRAPSQLRFGVVRAEGQFEAACGVALPGHLLAHKAQHVPHWTNSRLPGAIAVERAGAVARIYGIPGPWPTRLGKATAQAYAETNGNPRYPGRSRSTSSGSSHSS